MIYLNWVPITKLLEPTTIYRLVSLVKPAFYGSAKLVKLLQTGKIYYACTSSADLIVEVILRD